MHRDTAVGAIGSVILTAGYLAVGILREYSLPPELADWLGLVAVAVVVGGVVAVAANQAVPPERRTRRGHARTALTMALLPTVVAVALLAVLFGIAAGLVDLLDGLLRTAPDVGFLGGVLAVVVLVTLFVAVVVLVLLALGVLVGGFVLNGSALLAYSVVTVVLERAERSDPGRATDTDPPDGPG